MTRKRTFLFFSIIWFAGFIFILLKGKLAHDALVNGGNLELPIALIAYIYWRGGSTHAGIFAFVQGLYTDIFSGGFEGLFVFVYLCGLGMMWLCSRFIELSNPRGQIFVVALTWLVVKALFFGMLTTLGSNVNFSPIFVRSMIISLLATALLTPFVFHLLNRLNAVVGAMVGKKGVMDVP